MFESILCQVTEYDTDVLAPTHTTPYEAVD
jgi:hypothetical protein